MADAGLSPPRVVADFSLRARRRGFDNVADPSTYCARLYDGSGSAAASPESPRPTRDRLAERHRTWRWPSGSRWRPESPLAIAHRTARSKVLGVQVLVDGSCLGRREMGTQVQTVALIRALAASDDVDRVAVSLATDPPPYAAGALAHPKVTPARRARGGGGLRHRRRGAPPVPARRALDVDGWRAVGRRTVLTVLDLISYRSPAYHPSTDGWVAYRGRWRRRSPGRRVVTPSHDVNLQLRTERLPIDEGRLRTAELGTDHLGGDEAGVHPRRPPRAGLRRRTVRAGHGGELRPQEPRHRLRHRGRAPPAGRRRALVAAGAGVPFGSSRVAEAGAGGDAPAFVLPDLKAEERNWLLRHAGVVLYPTSAEGFGFVPSEAARFGTPTVFVPTGPLAENLPRPARRRRRLEPGVTGRLAEQLLADPALGRAQVKAVLAAGAAYTWDATAAKLVDIYRSILSLPPG